MKIIVSKNKKYISIHVECDDERSLSWEELQDIKNEFYPDYDFFEVYPKKRNVVNKANVRHLICIRYWACPQLSDLERKSKIEIHER